MNKRSLISAFITTLFVGVCLGMLIAPHPHPVSWFWLIYGGIWVAFAFWYFYRTIPLNSRFPISLWPVWAKTAWGILAAIAVVRFVHAIFSQ